MPELLSKCMCIMNVKRILTLKIIVFSPRSNKSSCRSLHCVTGGLLSPSQQVLSLNMEIWILESIWKVTVN